MTHEFDTTAADRFDHTFDDAVAQGDRLVTVDFSDVSFVDSSGLRRLVRARNQLAEVDGHLTAAGLSGAAQQVLEISGLIDDVTTHDSHT